MPIRTVSTKRAPETKGAGTPAPVGKAAHAVTWPVKPSSTWFVYLYSMSANERVSVAKRGVPAVFISHLAKAIGEPKEHVIAWTSLSRATVNRKARAKQSLSVVDSERVIGLAKLVGQVQAMVNESGDAAGFD